MANRSALVIVTPWLSAPLLATLATFHPPTLAQITPDGTLPTVVNSSNGLDYHITGGSQVGGNLFHSFGQFSIPTGGSGVFANALTIQNIISRVTGGSPSNIDGLLQVNGSTNLFLLNPSGITFGPNASLNLGGSFFASTASALKFADGTEFSATNLQTPPLLTIAVPIGPQFNTTQPPATLSNRAQLTVPGNLTLAAGNLDLQGTLTAGGNLTLRATNTVQIRNSGTSLFLAWSNGNMTIQGDQGIDILALPPSQPANSPVPLANFTAFRSGGNFSLVSNGAISADAHFASGGQFRVASLSGKPATLTSRYDPIISAEGDVEIFGDYTGASLKIESLGSISIQGNITITGPDVGLSTGFLSSGEVNIDSTGGSFNSATLSNDGAVVSSAVLAGFLGIPDDTLTLLGNDTPVEGSAIKTTVTLNPGQNQDISFLWAFTTDEAPATASTYNDFAFAVITSDVGGLVDLVTLQNAAGSSSGSPFFTTLTNATLNPVNFNVGIGVVDVEDDSVQSSLSVSGYSPGIILPSDPDAQILASSPSLILRAGVSALANPVNVPVAVGGAAIVELAPPPSFPATLTIAGNIDTSNAPSGIAGDAGLVTLTAPGDITINGSIQTANPLSTTAGSVTIASSQGNVNFQGDILTGTGATGTINSGDITIVAQTGSVQLDGSFLNVTTGNAQAGTIAISAGSTSTDLTAPAIALLNTRIDLAAFGEMGLTGSVLFSAPNGGAILLQGNGNEIFSDTFAKDDRSLGTKTGGDIRIIGGSIAINTYQLVATVNVDSTGNGGDIFIQGSTIDLTNSAISTKVDSNAQGQGGNIVLEGNTGNVTITNSQIDTSTQGLGNAGSMTLKAPEAIVIDGSDTKISSGVNVGGSGGGGNIDIVAKTIAIANGAQLTASTQGTGHGGNLLIQATDSVTIDGSGTNIASGVSTEGSGDGGNLGIIAQQVAIANGAQLTASTQGTGQGGNLLIQASDSVTIDGDRTDISSGVGKGGAGDGGFLEIIAKTAALTNGATLTASTQGSGNGGNLFIQAAQGVSFESGSRVFIGVTKGATGTGGSLGIITDRLSVTGLAQLSASTAGAGDGGAIGLLAGTILLQGNDGKGNASGLFSRVEPGATGNAGLIQIQADTLQLQQGAQINTNTAGAGNAGAIDILVTGATTLSGSQSGLFASTRDFTIPTNGITITEIGEAGQLPLTAQDLTPQSGITQITGRLDPSGDVDLYKISLTGGGTFSATTVGGSDVDTQLFLFAADGTGIYANDDDLGLQSTLPADNPLTPNAAGTYFLGISAFGTNPLSNGESIFASDATIAIPIGTSGRSPLTAWASDSDATGDYTITLTGLFTAADQSITLPGGNGGNVVLQTGSLTIADGAQIAATTAGQGNAGSITVNANIVDAQTAGQLTTSTSGSGNAGDINLNVVDRLALDGTNTGLFANTTPNSSGTGGSITIDPRLVTITNGATISVNSQGSGNGGDITLQAGTLSLDRGSITAETASGEGGNITLKVSDLILLRNQSLISATAGGTGNGGNLNLSGLFIVALPTENSDIIANAFQGRGGQINITTQGIFGLEFRTRLTPFSDITASSEFGVQGVVTITTPNVDPSRGIVQLPETITDASQQISQGCRSNGEAGRFVATGRGGLPPNPSDLIGGDALWEDTRGEQPSQSTTSSTAQGRSLVPAQGWVMDDKGMVTLVASPQPLACHEQPKPRL